jgi:hypothetical protein
VTPVAKAHAQWSLSRKCPAFLILLSSPVYVTQQRRNAAGVGLVFEADLDTTEHSSLWVLQVFEGFVI